MVKEYKNLNEYYKVHLGGMASELKGKEVKETPKKKVVKKDENKSKTK